MPQGFVEIIVNRRQRGRPSPRRRIVFTTPAGIRCELGDQVSPALIQAVCRLVLRWKKPC